MEITRVKFIAAGAQITEIYYDTYGSFGSVSPARGVVLNECNKITVIG